MCDILIDVASFCLVVSTVVDDDGDEEEEAAAVESEESDTEEAMETETDTKTTTIETATVVTMDTGAAETVEGVAMETTATESIEEPKAVPARKPTPSTTAAPSGLPQSKAELEALITSIHATVQNAVLPRLHKCLTAKVHTRSNTHQLYSLSGIFWNVSPMHV